MKKLLLILLCLPFIGFGQADKKYFDKAYDYGENGEYQLAINNYSKAIRINPDNASAYLNRGVAYEGLEKYEEAIADYTRAIKIDPEYAEKGYMKIGIIKGDLQKHTEAITYFTKVIEINDSSSTAYFMRANSYRLTNLPYCKDLLMACVLSEAGADLGNGYCVLYFRECDDKTKTKENNQKQ
tara:strand:+ start:602 stop:1150 length:549 start_codon:yes stop_codon:yes gene_type:complete